MYVCLCKQVTDKEIEAAISAGHTDLESLGHHLGVGTGCGCCRGYTTDLISEVTGRSEPVMVEPVIAA